MVLNVWQAVTKQRLQQLVGSDPEVRASMPSLDLAGAVRTPGRSLAQIVETVMLTYADRLAVAEHPSGHRVGSDHASFDRVSYADLWARARAVATVWQNSTHGPRAGDLLCSLGAASTAYATVELACIAAGVVSVPLAPTSSRAERTALLTETQPTILVVDLAQLAPTVEALLAADCPSPRSIVLLDYHDGDPQAGPAIQAARDRLHAAGRPLPIELLDDQVSQGLGQPSVPLHVAADPEALAQILYTSGATGAPKGAMFGARHVAALWIAQAQAQMPAIVTHYMPMSHTAGRMVLTGALARGGTCYFSTGSDPAKMWADVAATRPTEFFLIPRLCEMVRDRYRSALRILLAAGADPATAEDQARERVRTGMLGGRVVSAVNGSAPLEPDLRSLVAEILQVPVHDAYGSTEAGGVVLFNNLIQRPPVVDYKLNDVPELGYYATDRPHPRGELLVKTLSMVPGYYRRPELNATMFDEDGYYRTGDVMAQTGPDELVFVERRNNTLKLSQAEFVAVATLEAVFATSPHIDQIFIYGRNGRPDLLAVVVPTAESATRLSDPQLRVVIADSLRELAKEHDLRPYEIPRDFVVDPVPFSVENGLATGLSKPIRPRLAEHYGPRLERLYLELDNAQADEFAGLRQSAADRPVLDTIILAAQAFVGGGTSLPVQATFAELGGDSMAAYELSSRLSEIFDLDVPSTMILSPATTLATIADFIEAERRTEHRRPTARSVHADPTHLRATELTLETFLDPTTLEAATTTGRTGPGAGTVLLTGANGYLGRFVLLELLRRAKVGAGSVVCLVRAADTQTAYQRLVAAFDSGDQELLATFHTLARGKLTVLAGDVSRPQLGLTADEWQRLAADVDEIIHPAAAVNHVLPYEELFGPNVNGTAELIRLAVTHHHKSIVYLSTVGVADQIPPGLFDEGSDIRQSCPQRRVRDEYANGYANTKWASEVLLREAHDRFGLPVTVFRSNLLLAHRNYRGQLNVPDMLTRLLLSVLLTGIAPTSFYRPNPDGSRKQAHFDGLPVDFVAGAVTRLRSEEAGYTTYNLVNPHTDDDVSLDTLIDWLNGDEATFTRLPYPEWVNRLQIGLQALPGHLRQRSLLPLLHAFAEPEMLPELVVPAAKFQEAVSRHGLGGGQIPAITKALIRKYVDDLQAVGLLDVLPAGSTGREVVGATASA